MEKEADIGTAVANSQQNNVISVCSVIAYLFYLLTHVKEKERSRLAIKC